MLTVSSSLHCGRALNHRMKKNLSIYVTLTLSSCLPPSYSPSLLSSLVSLAHRNNFLQGHVRSRAGGWHTRMLCRMYSCQGWDRFTKDRAADLLFFSLVTPTVTFSAVRFLPVCVSGCSVTPSAAALAAISFAFTAVLQEEIRAEDAV